MDIFERFTAEYQEYHGLSTARAREQVKTLRTLERLSGKTILDIEADDVRNFLSEMIADGAHPNTVRKKRNMIRPFFGWAFDADLVSAERLMRIQRIPSPRGSSGNSLPKPYSRPEIARMWRDLDASWSPDTRFLDRWKQGRSRWPRIWRYFMNAQISAMAHVALHAGLRRSEMYLAPLDDLHYDNEYVVVRFSAAKNTQGISESREVPMTGALSAALHRWIELRALLKPDHEALWLSLSPFNGNDWPQQPMSFERFGSMMGTVGGGYELHRLRHTCATEWLRAGVPIEKVSKLLGHGSIQQTLAYAKIVRQDLGKAMAKAEIEFSNAVGREAA